MSYGSGYDIIGAHELLASYLNDLSWGVLNAGPIAWLGQNNPLLLIPPLAFSTNPGEPDGPYTAEIIYQQGFVRVYAVTELECYGVGGTTIFSGGGITCDAAGDGVLVQRDYEFGHIPTPILIGQPQLRVTLPCSVAVGGGQTDPCVIGGAGVPAQYQLPVLYMVTVAMPIIKGVRWERSPQMAVCVRPWAHDAEGTRNDAEGTAAALTVAALPDWYMWGPNTGTAAGIPVNPKYKTGGTQ